jgi:DNA-binding transcriptional regulator YdaS (Cro superfamily)
MQVSSFADFRKSRPDLTLDATAKLFGVDRTTVLRWEKGEVPIPVKRLSIIEAITGIPREKLRPDFFEPIERRSRGAA